MHLFLFTCYTQLNPCDSVLLITDLIVGMYVQVLDQELGSTFKHRVKDTFVQWQQKSRSGASETHGFRTKELITAQEVCVIVSALNILYSPCSLELSWILLYLSLRRYHLL